MRENTCSCSRWTRAALAVAVLIPALALGVLAAQGVEGWSGRVVYVSIAGRDRGAGSSSDPVRTLAEAQALVRRLTRRVAGPITVSVAGGVFRLARPLFFGPADSGTGGHDVIWRSAPGQTAVLSGSRRLAGWTLANAARGLWTAPLPAGPPPRQLFVDGVRAYQAFGDLPVSLTKTTFGYHASRPIMARWRDPGRIEFVYVAQLGQMTIVICRVASIAGDSIRMAQPCWDNSTKRPNRLVGYNTVSIPTYAQNAYELLDRPGEFYVDPGRRLVYYLARRGQNMRRADVEAPVLQRLIELRGTPSRPVHDITFSNFVFMNTTWRQPGSPQGFSEVQSNFTLTGSRGYATEGLCRYAPAGSVGRCPYGAWTKEPGAIQAVYDQRLSFLGDRFEHLGAAALNLDNGSRYDTVRGCVFTDISGNGIEIGNVNLPRATGNARTVGVTVTDNRLFGMPAEYQGGVPILAGYVSDTTVAHNQIDHVAYAAISFGWGGWPDKIGHAAVPNNTHGNVISENLIFDYMQGLADGGGVYTQGVTGTNMANGERVTGNVIHDELQWGYALHSDDGASYVTYAHNVLYADTYDWGTSHINYAGRGRGFDPQVIRGNYWQQGTANRLSGLPEWSGRGVNFAANTIITGPNQAPRRLTADAGVSPAFRRLLAWRPEGSVVPNPPRQVTVLYAFRGSAYVTWFPSFATGGRNLDFYTVTGCRAGETASCTGPSLRISNEDYWAKGYAVVSGLSTGGTYAFQVVAHNASGFSTPSTFSYPVTISATGPGRTGPPVRLRFQGQRAVGTLAWYHPQPACSDRVIPGFAWPTRCQPVLAYVVTGPARRRSVLTGLRQLAGSNRGGRTIDVLDGLRPGRSYNVSVTAVTPAGAGPAATISIRSGAGGKRRASR